MGEPELIQQVLELVPWLYLLNELRCDSHCADGKTEGQKDEIICLRL